MNCQSPNLGIILCGNRVVIPKELRQKVIQLAHHGHYDLMKTKQLLREKVWFPGIDNLVKTSVEHCLLCQSVGTPNNPAPLCTAEIPKHPWDTVYVDFLGSFPNNFLEIRRRPQQYAHLKKRLQDMVYQIPLFQIMDLHLPAMS